MKERELELKWILLTCHLTCHFESLW